MKFKLIPSNLILGFIISFLITCGFKHNKKNYIYIPKVERIPFVKIYNN